MMLRTFRYRLFLLPLAAAMLMAAAPSHEAAAQEPAANTVFLKDFDFSPMSLTVAAGTTVTWKNLDGEVHTVVSDDGTFRSPALDGNDTYSFTFDKPGIYKYICSIHPRMMAQIVVK